LQDAVLTAARMAVQNVEHTLATLVHQLIDQSGDAIDLVRIDALTLQRIEAVAAAVERHFALRRRAAHQHRDSTKVARVGDALRSDLVCFSHDSPRPRCAPLC
jgi:hypothetical protein